eukprot:m.3215 g.3215  ORF g.3215 m.3215 type:complete len:264 (-) comp2714_c0_seq1:50-841(-)
MVSLLKPEMEASMKGLFLGQHVPVGNTRREKVDNATLNRLAACKRGKTEGHRTNVTIHEQAIVFDCEGSQFSVQMEHIQCVGLAHGLKSDSKDYAYICILCRKPKERKIIGMVWKPESRQTMRDFLRAFQYTVHTRKKRRKSFLHGPTNAWTDKDAKVQRCGNSALKKRPKQKKSRKPASDECPLEWLENNAHAVLNTVDRPDSDIELDEDEDECDDRVGSLMSFIRTKSRKGRRSTSGLASTSRSSDYDAKRMPRLARHSTG